MSEESGRRAGARKPPEILFAVRNLRPAGADEVRRSPEGTKLFVTGGFNPYCYTHLSIFKQISQEIFPWLIYILQLTEGVH